MTLATVPDLTGAEEKARTPSIHPAALGATAAGRPSGGPQDLRQANLSQILRYLHEHGSSSRRDIAAGCGLAISTLTALIGELKARQLVTEMPAVRRAPQAGRPTRPIALDGEPWCVLGVYLTRDTVTALAATVGGRELWLDSRRCQVQSRLTGQIRDLVLDHVDPLDLRRVVAVTAAVSDSLSPIIDLTAEDLRATLTSADLIEENCLVALSAATPLASLQAVRQVGLGRGATAVYVGGLGELTGGLILDGRVFSGAEKAAGSLAHTGVAAAGAGCECGRANCLSRVAGPSALLTRSGLLDESAAELLLLEDPKSAISLLRSRATAGDARVLAALDVAGLALGEVLDGAIGLLDPHAVIFDGYLGSLYPYLKPSLAARLRSTDRIRVIYKMDPARAARGAVLASQSSILAAPLALTRPI